MAISLRPARVESPNRSRVAGEPPAAEISAQERRERAFRDLDAFERLIQEMSVAALEMRACLEGQALEAMSVGTGANQEGWAHAVQASVERAREKLAQRIPEPPRRAAPPSGTPAPQ